MEQKSVRLQPTMKPLWHTYLFLQRRISLIRVFSSEPSMVKIHDIKSWKIFSVVASFESAFELFSRFVCVFFVCSLECSCVIHFLSMTRLLRWIRLTLSWSITTLDWLLRRKHQMTLFLIHTYIYLNGNRIYFSDRKLHIKLHANSSEKNKSNIWFLVNALFLKVSQSGPLSTTLENWRDTSSLKVRV